MNLSELMTTNACPNTKGRAKAPGNMCTVENSGLHSVERPNSLKVQIS